ncbi:MAG: VOC family protein [Pseudomonadales bacterium]|nr:VOC family protein [Pseudomonadales bacterium]
MKFKTMIPMLNICNIDESLEFYKTALNFSIVSDPAMVQEWRWATIRSGDVELMLAETESPSCFDKGIDPQENTKWPAIFYFYPASVHSLHSHLIDHGYKPTKIVDTVYGMKEFSIQDPDGHMLSFGEDAKE